MEDNSKCFRCTCTCSIITIDHYKEDDYEDITFTFYERVRYPNEKFINRVKRFFKRLIGKDCLIGDIMLSREDFEKFKETINQI